MHKEKESTSVVVAGRRFDYEGHELRTHRIIISISQHYDKSRRGDARSQLKQAI